MPGGTWACAVCGAGQDPSNGPFLWSTLALSALPLLMLAGGAIWLRWHLRGRWAEEMSEREVSAEAAGESPSA